jgi:hypothetical protein
LSADELGEPLAQVTGGVPPSDVFDNTEELELLVVGRVGGSAAVIAAWSSARTVWR